MLAPPSRICTRRQDKTSALSCQVPAVNAKVPGHTCRPVLPLRDNVPTRTFPIVTVGLIAANVLVYLWESSGKGLDAHITEWGYYPCAVQGPCEGAAVQHHEVVATLFTSMFMHAGIVHIGGNMLFLWIFGNNVEDALGRVRFLVWYLLGGIAAA